MPNSRKIANQASAEACVGQGGSNLGFTGREHDESGLNYNRDRYLNLAMGTWTQVDKLASASSYNQVAQRFSQQLPLHAWRISAEIGASASARQPAGAYLYGAANPASRRDPSGLSPDCAKEWWIGAPLVFGEVSMGPVSVVLFGGVYSSVDSGRQVLVWSMLWEFGLFLDGSPDSLMSVSPEFGLGFGVERDVSRAEFVDEDFVESVYQLGVLVLVYGEHGDAGFFASHAAAGAGVLLGSGALTGSHEVHVWDL